MKTSPGNIAAVYCSLRNPRAMKCLYVIEPCQLYFNSISEIYCYVLCVIYASWEHIK